MAHRTLTKTHRRLSANEIRRVYLTERTTAVSYFCPFGDAETAVTAHPFVMPRRPATRRPWASRVSRLRVMPASHDMSR